MQKKVILTERQQIQIDNLIKPSKFNIVTTEILKNKKYNTDQKSRLILQLKYDLFGKK